MQQSNSLHKGPAQGLNPKILEQVQTISEDETMQHGLGDLNPDHNKNYQSVIEMSNATSNSSHNGPAQGLDAKL